jgi:hypothetical protein
MESAWVLTSAIRVDERRTAPMVGIFLTAVEDQPPNTPRGTPKSALMRKRPGHIG